MTIWNFSKVTGEKLDFFYDILLYIKLDKGKPWEPGHPIYEQGAKMKLWTRRNKKLFVKTYRNRTTNSFTVEVRNASSSQLTLHMDEINYNRTMKG